MIRQAFTFAALWTAAGVVFCGLWTACRMLGQLYVATDPATDPFLTTEGYLTPDDVAARITAMLADVPAGGLSDAERLAFEEIVAAERHRSMRAHPSQQERDA